MAPIKKSGPTEGTKKWFRHQERNFLQNKKGKWFKKNQGENAGVVVHKDLSTDWDVNHGEDPQFDDLQGKLEGFDGKPQEQGTFPTKKRSGVVFRKQHWVRPSKNYIKFESDSEEDEENMQNMKKHLMKSVNYSKGSEDDKKLKNPWDKIPLSEDDHEEVDEDGFEESQIETKPKSKVEEKKNSRLNTKSNLFETFDKKADMKRRKNYIEESEDESEEDEVEMKPKSKVEEKKNPPQKTRNQKAADKAKNPQPNMKSNPFEAFDKKADMERRKNCGEESESEDEVPLLNSSHKKIYSGTMNPDDEDMDTESSEAEDYDDEEEDIVKDELNDLKELKKKIDNMPLAKALEMKEKLGLKLWNMIQNGDVEETVKNSNEDLDEGSDDEAPTETTTKRSKNAPREMSWKKPVSVLRNIEFADSNYERRRFDPRFEKKSGQFIESEFARDYGFLHELQQNDLKTLQTEMKKNKSNPSKYQQLKNVSMKLKQQLTSQREKQFWSETKAELKQKNIERMNAGMKPIFVSNKNLEKMIAEKRLQWQVAAGKGDKYEKNRQKRLEKKQGRKNVLGIN